MSESLRDMYVGIQFDDGASKTIDKIDGKMDELESGFVKFGTKVDKSGTGLQAMGKVGMQATTQLSTGFKKSERGVDGFSNEVDDTHSGLKKIGSEGDKATSKLERGFDKSEKEAKDFTREVNNSGNALGGIKKAAMGLAGIIAGVFAVDKIKDFAISGIEKAANVKALDSQFGQVFGNMEKTAATNLNSIAKETGVLPERLKGSFVQMTAFAKTTGADTAAAMSLAERATMAAADSAAFYDRGIEDVTDNLQSLLKGNFENDASLGISVTETTRNTAAMKLFNKEYKKLNESQKQLTLLQMVEDGNKAAGAIGQAAREADGYENVIGNLKSSWDKLKGSMMNPFLDTVTGSLQGLTAKLSSIDGEAIGLKMKAGFESTMDVVVPTFNAIKDGIGWVMENKDPLIAGLAGVTAGFVALNVINTVSGLMKVYQASTFASTVATQGFNAALRANPIGLVVTAIGLLVAGGVLLYQNWDTVKAKAGELWGVVTDKFAGIKQGVSDFVQPAIGWFDTIKQKWDSFKSSLANFKMPEWVSTVGGAIGGAVSKVSGWVNGSHATGLANVPFDDYRANLHKGESVLTADQSNSLRGMGILGANSDGTPTVNPAALSTPVPVATPVNAGGGSSIQISVPIELNIQGNADDAVVQKLLSMLPGEVQRIFDDIFRQKLAGIGG